MAYNAGWGAWGAALVAFATLSVVSGKKCRNPLGGDGAGACATFGQRAPVLFVARADQALVQRLAGDAQQACSHALIAVGTLQCFEY